MENTLHLGEMVYKWVGDGVFCHFIGWPLNRVIAEIALADTSQGSY